MSNKKQFGVWMDSQQAIVVGNESNEGGQFSVLAHVSGDSFYSNSNENASNNHENTEQVKFFNAIASHLLNATHVHITGTGQAQEQFGHYLSSTPEFKNSVTDDSTSNKMSDEKLIEYISGKF